MNLPLIGAFLHYVSFREKCDIHTLNPGKRKKAGLRSLEGHFWNEAGTNGLMTFPAANMPQALFLLASQ
jgi:hypothetical protein